MKELKKMNYQQETYKCRYCSETKPAELFTTIYQCKSCRAVLMHEWYIKNKPKILRQTTEYYYSIYTASEQKQHSATINNMLSSAKKRAKDKGIEFSLTKADIVIPDTCPVLAIPIINRFKEEKRGKFFHNSPSLDRKDNDEGYTKDNIRVISARANNLKNNGTLEEFKAIVRYMESE